MMRYGLPMDLSSRRRVDRPAARSVRDVDQGLPPIRPTKHSLPRIAVMSSIYSSVAESKVLLTLSSIIEAADLTEVIRLIAATPCA